MDKEGSAMNRDSGPVRPPADQQVVVDGQGPADTETDQDSQPLVASSNRRRRLMGLTLALLPLGFLMVYVGIQGENFDFEIYRGALTDMLHGNSVYAFSVLSSGFIYPPFASLVMLPLAFVSLGVGKALLAVVTTVLVLVALVGSFSVVDARRQAVGRKKVSLIIWGLVSILIAVSIPTVANMHLGQVSFAVAALVLIDVALLPPRWRGVLVGLAGAIKLTPMILVPYYLVTRQWRAALNACGAFGLAAVTGAIFRWPDSVRYWLQRDVIGNSLGDPARWDNWSIYGDLSRLGLNGSTLHISWVIGSAIALGFAAWRASRHFLQGQELEATLIMGISAGLVTQVTWTHHLLLLVVACALLAIRRPAIGIPALVAVTVAGYLARVLIGFLVVPLMLALVLFGVSGDLRSASWWHRPDRVIRRES
jgi:alpha-1,2-mannosyltransferase